MPQAWPPSAPGGPTTAYDAMLETIGAEMASDPDTESETITADVGAMKRDERAAWLARLRETCVGG